MEKINFQNGITPLNDTNLNQMQENVEKEFNSKYKLLWENNNQSSQFDGSQNISLNSDDYDLLMWFYKRDKDVDFVASNIIPKGHGGVMGYVNTYDGQNSAFREIIRHSDTTFEISSAFKGAVNMENTQIIPIQVIGVKF